MQAGFPAKNNTKGALRVNRNDSGPDRQSIGWNLLSSVMPRGAAESGYALL